MPEKPFVLIGVSVLLLAVLAGGIIGWRFAIFVLPFRWTGEPARLADLLRLRPGSTVADIGAGNGALAVEIARLVGDRGLVYATELSATRQREIEAQAARAGAGHLRVVAATSDRTHLPDACCDAIYMRTVLHHIADREAFARQTREALRAGGRLAIIDFPPGGLWFHGRDHGVTATDAVRAFQAGGLTPLTRIENWGGGTYLLLFGRGAD